MQSMSESVDAFPELIGSSPCMRQVKVWISRIAPLNTTVLITGETGTGKEVVAGLLHRQSARANRQFVSVNCAAIPETLLESELFGHVRGAFTGAVQDYPGKFRLAHGGTLFLDEIGDMSLPAQARILRALEQNEVTPLGGARPVRVDIRIVTATNRDLDQQVSGGSFRSDLFYRLCVTEIRLPPLRERREDIPELADHFLERIRAKHGLRLEGFTPGALNRLAEQDWPGNVRQLRNRIESAALTVDGRYITEADVQLLSSFRTSVPMPLRMARGTPTEHGPEAEPERLLRELRSTNWNVSQAADRLHWGRATMYRKMAKYRISREQSSVSHVSIR